MAERERYRAALERIQKIAARNVRHPLGLLNDPHSTINSIAKVALATPATNAAGEGRTYASIARERGEDFITLGSGIDDFYVCCHCEAASNGVYHSGGTKESIVHRPNCTLVTQDKWYD